MPPKSSANIFPRRKVSPNGFGEGRPVVSGKGRNAGVLRCFKQTAVLEAFLIIIRKRLSDPIAPVGPIPK